MQTMQKTVLLVALCAMVVMTQQVNGMQQQPWTPVKKVLVTALAAGSLGVGYWMYRVLLGAGSRQTPTTTQVQNPRDTVPVNNTVVSGDNNTIQNTIVSNPRVIVVQEQQFQPPLTNKGGGKRMDTNSGTTGNGGTINTLHVIRCIVGEGLKKVRSKTGSAKIHTINNSGNEQNEVNERVPRMTVMSIVTREQEKPQHQWSSTGKLLGGDYEGYYRCKKLEEKLFADLKREHGENWYQVYVQLYRTKDTESKQEQEMNDKKSSNCVIL